MGVTTSTARSNNFLSIKHKAVCRELQERPVTQKEIEDAIAAGYQEITVNNPSKPLPEGGFETVQKWVQKFASVKGKILDAEWYDREAKGFRWIGIKLKIKDVDDKEPYFLDLPFNNKEYNVFTRVMENIDYTKPVEICAWPDKSKPNATAVAFKQGEEFLKWKYTREDHQNILDDLYAKKMNDLAAEFENAINPKVKQPNGEITIDRNRAFISPDLRKKLLDAGYVVAPLPEPKEPTGWDFSKMQAFLYRRFIEVVQPHIKELNKFDDPQADEPDEAPAPYDPSKVDPDAPATQAAAAGLSAIQQAQNEVAAEQGKPTPYGNDDDIPF